MTPSTWAKERPTTDISSLMVATAAALVAAALPAPAHAADPVIAAAGNIACDPDQPLLRGRRGDGRRGAARPRPRRCCRPASPECSPSATPSTAAAPCPAYNASYQPGWGLPKAITHPGAGQPRLLDGRARRGTSTTSTARGAAAGPAGNRDQGYYSFDLGAWHLVALNSNCDAGRVRSGIRAGALAARGPRRPPHVLHACLHARRALQLRARPAERSPWARSTGPSTRAASTSRWPATHATTSGSRPRPASGEPGVRHPPVRGRHRRPLARDASERRRSTARCARTRPSGSSS